MDTAIELYNEASKLCVQGHSECPNQDVCSVEKLVCFELLDAACKQLEITTI